MKTGNVKQFLFNPTIWTAAIALALTACGNQGGALQSQNALDAQNSSNAQALTSGPMVPYHNLFGPDGKDGVGCPESPNIHPDEDWFSDGSMVFTACTNAKQSEIVTIRGRASAGTRICVFPAEQMTANHIASKPDITTGFPLYRCGASDDFYGVALTFPKEIKFNYLFIVKQSDALTMQRCLFTGNYTSCPIYRPSTFSSGKFRD